MKALLSLSLGCFVVAACWAESALASTHLFVTSSAVGATVMGQLPSGSSEDRANSAPPLLQRFLPGQGSDQKETPPPSDPFSAERGSSFRASFSDAPAARPGEPNPLELPGGTLNRLPPTAIRPASNLDPGARPTAAATRRPSEGAKGEALRLVAQGRAAFDRGDLVTAQRLAERAQTLNVPEARAWELLLRIESTAGLRNRGRDSGVGAWAPARVFRDRSVAGVYSPCSTA